MLTHQLSPLRLAGSSSLIQTQRRRKRLPTKLTCMRATMKASSECWAGTEKGGGSDEQRDRAPGDCSHSWRDCLCRRQPGRLRFLSAGRTLLLASVYTVGRSSHEAPAAGHVQRHPPTRHAKSLRTRENALPCRDTSPADYQNGRAVGIFLPRKEPADWCTQAIVGPPSQRHQWQSSCSANLNATGICIEGRTG